MSDSEPKSNGSDKFDELRDILFPERAQFDSLQEKLENPELLAENVSHVLPDAVRMRSQRDDDLTHALSPAVEKSLQISVQKNPQPIVDAIFPIIGPAIRKAISAAISGLVQSLNQTLEYSLSVRGLKWRWEAIRTGKTFAEVVLLRSLLYRVEQVFLIHRETGLLLQHVSAIRSQSPDLISGMLTAIQDFVRDSFHVQESETLDAMRVGDLSVWIEQGPQAILAAVIRGNAPQDLRSMLQTTLENIHQEKSRALQKFQGDAGPFESIRPDLEECLQSRYKTAQKKESRLAWVVFALLFAGVVAWLGFYFFQKYRVNSLEERLNAEPGIVVTSIEKRDGKYQLNGLRDPLAPDPQTWLSDFGLRPNDVVFHWEPYQAIHPEFLVRRANVLLAPPSTVTLTMKQGILAAKGRASTAWIAEAEKLARALPGMDRFDVSALEPEEMYTLKKQIEAAIFRFHTGTAELASGQEQEVDGIAEDFRHLIDLAQSFKKQLVIQAIGRADTTGDEMGNLQLSQERTGALIGLLVLRDVPLGVFKPVAKGSEEPLRQEKSEEDREWNRSVTFRVDWRDAGETP